MQEGESPEPMESDDDQRSAKSDRTIDGSSEYWARKSNEILGPFTASDLGELTRQDHFDGFIKISADSSIWRDQELPTQSRSNATTSVMPIQLLDDEEVQDDQSHREAHEEFDLPVLRIENGFVRNGFIAVGRGRILRGRRNFGGLSVGPEQMDSTGLDELSHLTPESIESPIEDLVEVREGVAPILTGAKNELRPGSLTRMTFQFRHHRQFKLSIPVEHAPMLRQAIAQQVGDIFKIRRYPILGKLAATSGAALFLIVLTIAMLTGEKTSYKALLIALALLALGLLNVWFRLRGPYLRASEVQNLGDGAVSRDKARTDGTPFKDRSIVAKMFYLILKISYVSFLLLLLSLSGLFLLSGEGLRDPAMPSCLMLIAICALYLFAARTLKPWRRSKKTEKSESRNAVNGRQLRSGAQRRSRSRRLKQPFRSPLIGWVIKLASLAYIIVVQSPLSDPLGEVFSRSPSVQSILFGALLLPAIAGLRLGYRLSLRPYVAANADSDAETPTVFLRPFDDDLKTTLQPTGWFARLSGIRDDDPLAMMRERNLGTKAISQFHPVRVFRHFFNIGADTSEESLARYFGDKGPMVAIGRPGEAVAAPGASRVYLDDDTWQDRVSSLLKKAPYILMQPGITAGVRWELERCRESIDPQRLLICMAPYFREPEMFAEVRSVLRDSLGVSVPRHLPYLSHPCFLWFDRNWRPVVQQVSYRARSVWPIMGDAVDLNYTLSPFLNKGSETESRAAREPRWRHAWQPAALFSTYLGVLLSFVIAMIPPVGIRVATALIWPETNLAAPSTFHPSSSRRHSSEQPKPLGRTKLKGTRVNYEFSVPNGIVKYEPTDPRVEFMLASTDSELFVGVEVSEIWEDLSSLHESRLIVNNRESGGRARPVSNEVAFSGGGMWYESRVRVIVEGKEFLEIARGRSNISGSVVIWVAVPVDQKDQRWKLEAERIVSSMKMPF